ncbi:hypothetical protein JKF63_00889 [Porcisia hertigi]|uniref:Rab-GAP TBC domain-containing protein n=1 Tax=Porcisia hertigi TaxID=2761500 RepID=A0A836GZ45_9TRYP|nr:hypothetical protein JKF63_00889 [Porcisia hertigi]
MDEVSVFTRFDEDEGAQHNLARNTPLRISAAHAEGNSFTVKRDPSKVRDAPLTPSAHFATIETVLAESDDTVQGIPASPGRHSSRFPQGSIATLHDSFGHPGYMGHAVELVSSPLRLVTTDDEVQLDHSGPFIRAPQAAKAPVPCAAAVPRSGAVHPTPLIPENRRVVKGAGFPQALRNSQLRAAPTGCSDSDTDGGGNHHQLETRDAEDRHSQPGNDSLVDAEEREAEQQFVDEFGFVIDEDTKAKDEKYIRRIDGKQVMRREIKWANMAADWNKTHTKMNAKLKERCRKGIPSRFRGVAWQLLLGSFHQLNSEENNGVYAALREKKLASKEVDAIISRDLSRTFPTHVLFQDAGGVGQIFLRNVLHAYAGCDPEVGYVQGMGFLVAALSTQMAEEESFWALHEMMYNERYKMRELFRPGFPLLQQLFYQLKRLITRLLPRLSKRLDQLDIQPSFFASQWFLTLFVAHFPFRALLRVWDIFFSEGWKIIFRIGIALMKWEESRLLTLSFEEMLKALKSLQDGKDARELLRRAHRVKFKTAELNRYGDEYWEMMGSHSRD